MKTVVVKGQKRTALGKKESRKLRSQENIPAVLYGGIEPLHFSVSFSELRKLVYTPNVYLIDLDIEGEIYPALMQDVQWHAVEEQILHVDFFKIDAKKPVKIEVPIKVTGLAKGIKAGGKLKTTMRRLKVKALAENLPDNVVIDVTKLGIGQSIKVGDLSLNNVEFLDNKSNVVVGVIVTRAAKSAAGAAGEGEEETEEEVTTTEEAGASEE